MNITLFIKLTDIFVNKRWTENILYNSVLENFCYLLMNLSEVQRELILELIERYSWISPNECDAKLINALNSIEDEKLKNCNRIIVFPIMKPEDEDRIKSSHPIIYKIRGFKPFLTKYRDIEFNEIIKYNDITEENFEPADNDLIFLVDDYLGSGETIEATLSKVLTNRNIQLTHLIVVTIATQRDTIEFVTDKGIPIYYDHLEKKGITDNYEASIATEKKNIMLEIEKLVPGSKLFSLGFNQSEALITLTRTPDNTFPIFWKEHRKNGVSFKPPFPRY
jgi:hypothetical protein